MNSMQYWMNNKDDHAKNFSFVLHADGWHLAPPYDLTYCPGERGEHWMTVANEGKAPGRNHVLQAAVQAGLPDKLAGAIVDDITAALTPEVFVEEARKLPLLKSTVQEVGDAVANNHRRLLA